MCRRYLLTLKKTLIIWEYKTSAFLDGHIFMAANVLDINDSGVFLYTHDVLSISVTGF